MNSTRILIICVLIALTGCATSKPRTRTYGPTRVFTFSDYFRGMYYTYTFINEEIDTLPTWDPKLQACPIEQSNAVAKAQNALAKRFSDVAEWRLIGYELKKVPMSQGWICRVTMTAPDAERFQYAQNNISVVMNLDMHIFEPKESNEQPKRWTPP